MTDSLDQLLNGPEEADDGSEPTNRRGPRIATPSQVVSLAKRTLRQLYLGELKPHHGLAVLNGCKITLELMDKHQEPVDPLSDEGVTDEKQLAKVRRRQHEALLKWKEAHPEAVAASEAQAAADHAELLKTMRCSPAGERPMPREVEEGEERRETFELEEGPMEHQPQSTADALLRDGQRQKEETQW